MDGNSQTRAASTAEPALTISAVSEETGIPQATLRAWESRYGLAPSRTTAGGHRRYSSEDVSRLRVVRDLVAQGVPAGEAARSVLTTVADGSTLPHLTLPDGAPLEAHRLAITAMDLDGPAVRALMREHLSRHGVLDTWEKLLRPVLSAIGEQWADVPHGVAVEHLVSHLATVALGETLHRAPHAGDRAVLLACVPGELHDLPLIALWAALDVTRAPATLLGARTPADTLVKAAERLRPDVVVVFSLLPEWADTDLLKGIPAGTSVLAAGPGWDPAGVPPRARHVDDLLGAIELVTRLV